MTDRRCYACDRRYRTVRARCECGEPLWYPVRADRDAWPDGGDRDGVWRYASLLPVEGPVDGDADLGAGGTPLRRASRLDEYAGCRPSLKDEGQNPTGSFKDRGSAVGVAAVREGDADARRVGTVSHGNMALSTAAHAAAAGLPCTVVVPADIADERLRAIGRYDPRIVRVRGDYGRLYHDALELGPDRGIRFLNSDTPLRVAGQKTLAFELVDAAPDTDAIVLPASSGGNASAVWKGLLEARASGRIDDLPRLYLAQAAACDPIARAYREGAAAVEPLAEDAVDDTIATSIANPDPPSGTRALAAVRDTGGAVASAPDDEIREATRRLAGAGVRAEPASATALAGLRRLTRAGEIDADERVCCVVTGRGYGGDGDPPETIAVDRDALGDALAPDGRPDEA